MPDPDANHVELLGCTPRMRRWVLRMEGDVERLQATVGRQAKALALMGRPRCENLHHQKSDQHKGYESCPVEDRIEALLTPLAAEAAGRDEG